MNALDDMYILLFQEWDIKTKTAISKAEQKVLQEQERRQILKSCSYTEIISTPHLKEAMGW